MADSNFVVKNGLVVSNTVTVNATGVHVNTNFVLDATNYTGTANNASNLGGNPAANFVQNTDSRTLSGNLVFTGANVNFTGAKNDFVNLSVSNNQVYHAGNLNPANIEANSLASAIALAIALG